MKIVNPLSPSLAEEDIKTVLYALAGQGGCDGEPYDQMQAAADYIAELEKYRMFFESCSCYFAEGVEFMTKDEIYAAIQKETKQLECAKWEAK